MSFIADPNPQPIIPQQSVSASQQKVQVSEAVYNYVYTQTGSSVPTILDLKGYLGVTIQLTCGNVLNTYIFEGTNDIAAGNGSWSPLKVYNASFASLVDGNLVFVTSNVPNLFIFNRTTRYLRIRRGTISANASAIDTCRVLLSPNPITLNRENELLNPSGAWSYVAPSGGLTTTTLTQIQAAGNSSQKNFIRSLQLANASAAVGTEVFIVDGASTVIWRGYMPTNSQQTILFEPLLKSSYASALSVQCGTTASQIYVNAQGTQTNA